jgi:hypothetical protein
LALSRTKFRNLKLIESGALVGFRTFFYQSEMALFSECMLWCAHKVLDTGRHCQRRLFSPSGERLVGRESALRVHIRTTSSPEAGTKTNYLQVPVNPFVVLVPFGTVVPVIIPPGAIPFTSVNEAFGTAITLNVPLT